MDQKSTFLEVPIMLLCLIFAAVLVAGTACALGVITRMMG